MKGIDVAAAVIAADAKECKGKFASARSSDLVDSDVVFRGISSCEDSAGFRSAQYFIVPRKSGGFVLFSVMGAGSSGEAASPPASDLTVRSLPRAPALPEDKISEGKTLSPLEDIAAGVDRKIGWDDALPEAFRLREEAVLSDRGRTVRA